MNRCARPSWHAALGKTDVAADAATQYCRPMTAWGGEYRFAVLPHTVGLPCVIALAGLFGMYASIGMWLALLAHRRAGHGTRNKRHLYFLEVRTSVREI
jgi:hypothetical protein